MKEKKELVERLREARAAVRAEAAKSIRRQLRWYHISPPKDEDYEVNRPADAWADRFVVLRALKQQGDHAAFLNPTDEEDYARWCAALEERRYTHDLKPRARVRMYGEYVNTLFSFAPHIEIQFPRDALGRIFAILNRPDLAAAWSSEEKSVRGFIDLCARKADLWDMSPLQSAGKK